MASRVQSDHFYVNEHSSPYSVEGLSFYSAPTSPTSKNTYEAAFHHGTEPTTPNFYEDANSNFIDEFEFETSRRFNLGKNESSQSGQKSEHYLDSAQQSRRRKQQEEQSKDSLPAMAFADELFCDGKVMPLKPPPCLKYVNNQSSPSMLPSPRSPTSVLKIPFSRRSLWNDDFDPFMVALENVREERDGDKSHGNLNDNHRRDRSLSPFRAGSPRRSNDLVGPSGHNQINEMGLISPEQKLPNGSAYSVRDPNRNGQEQKSPIKLTEPKGVLYARRARLVKVGQEEHSKADDVKTPTVSTGESGKDSEPTCARESQRQKVKKFLFRSASIGKTSNEGKPKPSFTRKFSLRSTKLIQYNEEKRVSRVAKITLAQYRPRLFLCVGYGGKYARQ